jgi:hypothetical protein
VDVITAGAETAEPVDRVAVAAEALFPAASEPAAIRIAVIAVAGMSRLDRDGPSLLVLTSPPAWHETGRDEAALGKVPAARHASSSSRPVTHRDSIITQNYGVKSSLIKMIW